MTKQEAEAKCKAKNAEPGSTNNYPIHVTIQRMSDGKMVDFWDTTWGHDGDNQPSTFMWAEGNYSCDCNRELFFSRALGHEPSDEEHENMTCTSGKYRVRLRFEGQLIYDDFPGGAEEFYLNL